MMLAKALASASASVPKVYVEDVFSTWLYTGNSSTQTITNGIDLSGKGGLVWIKSRSLAQSHFLFDTERGADKALTSNDTAAQSAGWTPNWFTSFNSSGFTLGPNGLQLNSSTGTYASWTFRKAPKFFDVVAWTGSGANRTIAHSLGSVPGTIIVKRTDTTGDWQVYHRSLANTEYLVLNSTAAKATGATRWNSTTPTSTVFSLGTDATVNASGGTYVAYLFAHDAGGFGASGNESVVKCGSFTTDASGDATVDLGWEPQWVLIKNTSAAENWKLVDTMRGFVNNGRGFDDNVLSPNLSSAEATGTRFGYPTATGFFVYEQFSSNTYIYIAIRRGPMKTPTDATKVFQTQLWTGDTTSPTGTRILSGITGHPTDLFIGTERVDTFNHNYFYDRLRGLPFLTSVATNGENGNFTVSFDYSSGLKLNDYALNYSGRTYAGWNFRRAPGFCDVVAYTGNGTFDGSYNVNHSLGVTPEFIIVKRRDSSNYWNCYHVALTSATYNIQLNLASAQLNTGQSWGPTSTTFKPQYAGNTNYSSNDNTATYIAYLFATCPGVSKVGSYTGTGTTLNVDCGFTNGARFVLIKRTDSTGDWYVWDTARGIIAANDPYLLLNSTAAEVTNTDYIDPLSSGFQISSTAPAAINANGGSFIFLAIA